MRKQRKNFRDAIFVITEERGCPIYNVGEELKVEKSSLFVPTHKPGCLILAEEITKIVTSKDNFSGFSKLGVHKSRFDCGKCQGSIHFEFKKEKGYATLQMKLLDQTEERRRRQRLEKFFDVFRDLSIFESLDDDALTDLTVLLDVKTIPEGKVVIKQGTPGSHLYIILNGELSVKADDGSNIAGLSPGNIFGEMSLLTGEPATTSIHTVTATQVAMLSIKNFKHVLKKHPVLQLFLLKMLVDRAQTMTLRSGNIASGMTGELAEIPAIDLFQLINSSQKTGSIHLLLGQGKAMVFFKEGEIIYARFLNLQNQDAVYALLGVKSGHFSYTRGIPSKLDKLPPIGGFMGIIMEGLQRLDEHKD